MLPHKIAELHVRARSAAFAYYIRKGYVPKEISAILEATRSVAAFVKYNPDQARVPAGNEASSIEEHRDEIFDC